MGSGELVWGLWAMFGDLRIKLNYVPCLSVQSCNNTTPHKARIESDDFAQS